MADELPFLDPTSHYAQLCSAVGLMFLQWAALENEMAASLRAHLQRQAKNPERGMSLACAIYGSMRMKAARDTMKRIAIEHEYGAKALAFHETFFSHVGHLEDFRDKLAHQFALKLNRDEDGHWIVLDAVTSRTYRTMKVYTFETKAVRNAAYDLRFAANVMGDYLKKGARRSAPQIPAWRYKPSALKLLPEKTAISLLGHMLQPGA